MQKGYYYSFRQLSVHLNNCNEMNSNYRLTINVQNCVFWRQQNKKVITFFTLVNGDSITSNVICTEKIHRNELGFGLVHKLEEKALHTMDSKSISPSTYSIRAIETVIDDVCFCHHINRLKLLGESIVAK